MPRAFALSKFTTATIRRTRSTSSMPSSKDSPSASARCERRTAMSFRPYSTAKSRTWAFATPLSNQRRRNLTARLIGHIERISKSSITTHIHRLCRSARKSLRMGKILQPLQISRGIQRKGTLRNPTLATITNGRSFISAHILERIHRQCRCAHGRMRTDPLRG